jgi:hypothetical protein
MSQPTYVYGPMEIGLGWVSSGGQICEYATSDLERSKRFLDFASSDFSSGVIPARQSVVRYNVQHVTMTDSTGASIAWWQLSNITPTGAFEPIGPGTAEF